MRDRIPIEKDLIPYSFDILLGAELYEISISHNELSDRYTITLSKNQEVLVYNEPVVYGKPLFEDLYTRGDFPVLQIEPFDESGQQNTVTSENFNKTVFLTINQGGDE